MRRHNTDRILLFNLILLAFIYCPASAQQEKGNTQRNDVLRINTELVQTGVTVFDKKGRFVDGLKKQDFELRVDGRVIPLSFFESVIAGSRDDRLIRTAPKDPKPTLTSGSGPSFRQRTIIFFLDDLHLSLDSVGRTRKMLTNFINTEMGDNDLVAIASASSAFGQIIVMLLMPEIGKPVFGSIVWLYLTPSITAYFS